MWADFHPSAGHEQSGLRPALVISPHGYNARSSLLIVCPITNRDDKWPFRVRVDADLKIGGFIMVDQVKAVDRAARVKRLAGRVCAATLDEVRRLLSELVEINAGHAARVKD